MDKYEKEMYNFLTQPENFENMVKVMGFKDMVRDGLIVEFWELVILNLEQLNKTKEDRWMINKPKTKQDYFWGEDSSIDLYKVHWTQNGKDSPVTISWASPSGNMFYGIWVDKGFGNKDKVHEILKAKAHADKKNFDSSESWPFHSKEYGYNFLNFNELEYILPKRREALANEFANILFNLATEFETKLDELATIKHVAASVPLNE